MITIANLRSYQIEQAIERMKDARNLLHNAHATKSHAYICRCIKSAEGALRNRRRFEFEAAHGS